MSTAFAASATPATGWDEFRVLLETQRAEYAHQHELAVADTVTSVQDPVALSRVAGLARTLEEIDGALGRIAAGTYGRCVTCGGAIPEERLELRPFAAGCVACQQRSA